ncbi:hypothetical protein [Dolosigranulum pigrum]|uniref:hypothetical protein n=1 Tax=Dolosigranulum pigrum TaxID=29394 RepID=UPI001AD87994|nr:hypothetical protein [Dolosigranulum pigrum]QTJ56404.1 hypothetical protein FE335_02360 [Dolosigranulum pigrum]
MGTLEAINQVIMQGSRESVYVNQLKKDVHDDELMPVTGLPWGAAARAALTAIEEADYAGYDEATDYYLEGYTNILKRQETKESVLA